MRAFFKKHAKLGKSGVSLLEVMIATGIVFAALAAIVGSYQTFLSAGLANAKSVQAAFLLEEGIEAVLSLRDSDWSSFASLGGAGDRYLSFQSGIWTASAEESMIDQTFARKFTVSSVYRDAEDNIASSGTLDSNIKKVEVSVSWLTNRGTTTRNLSRYVANIFEL
ncbi:MAG: hypothetical protein Q8P52_03230 [bacterium]|nr:hypothetical protein [bacterium]